MKKIEKFLFCENELMGDSPLRGEYILHTRNPSMLIQIHNLTNENQVVDLNNDDIGNLKLSYVSSDRIEEIIILKVIFLYDSVTKDKVLSVLNRAADWYVSYLRWQDARIDQNADGLES